MKRLLCWWLGHRTTPATLNAAGIQAGLLLCTRCRKVVAVSDGKAIISTDRWYVHPMR